MDIKLAIPNTNRNMFVMVLNSTTLNESRIQIEALSQWNCSSELQREKCFAKTVDGRGKLFGNKRSSKDQNKQILQSTIKFTHLSQHFS